MIENKKDQDQRVKDTKFRKGKALEKDKQITELKILYANVNGTGDTINSIQSAAELYGAAKQKLNKSHPRYKDMGNG